MAAQSDRFGRPIPAEPGYKVIINNDGEVMQMRTTLYLDDTITATDDPDSDATRLHGGGSSGPGTAIKSVDVMSSLRGMTANPVSGRYETQGRFAVGDGGGWQYDWDSASTATDDGVLIIKVTNRAVGRFLAVKPTDGIINCLACGPAVADLSRTKSFDPSGVVAIGTELYRVTEILRNAGWSGIEMQNSGTGYLCSGPEQVAPSLAPYQPFYFGSKTGARVFGAVGDHVAPRGIGAYAYGLGDTTPSTGGSPTLIQCDHAGNPSWTQTLLPGDNTFVGVSDVTGLAVNDTIVAYLGAEITDAGGWCAQWVIAEIAQITVTASPVGNVRIKGMVPYVFPTTSGARGPQTHHTLRKLIRFQDGLDTRGLVLNNVFFAHQFARDCKFSTHWERGTFMHNHTACEGMLIEKWTADTSTGYDQGGGGAFAWYGNPCILQSCYGTRIDLVRVNNLEATSLITEELSSKGTTVGTVDITWSSRYNVGSGACGIFGAVGGNYDIISVEHMKTGGGYAAASIIPNVQFEVWENYSGPDYDNINASAGQANRLLWRGQGYRDKKKVTMIIPLHTTATTITHVVPCNGLVRSMLLRVQTPGSFTTLASIGISLTVDGTAGGTAYDISSGFITSKDTWFPINPASILSAGSPNFFGYCIPRLLVTSSGSTPAGSFLYAEIEMFLPELITSGQSVATDTSEPQVLGSNGPPAFNSKFVGQECIDNMSSPKSWYKSISVGSGAADWERIYKPVQGTALIDSNQTLTPGGTVGEYLMRNGVQTANRSDTISTSGATNGDRLIITSYETAGHTLAIVNGGAGAGTIYTFAGTIPKQLSIVFDGTNWTYPTVIPIN